MRLRMFIFLAIGVAVIAFTLYDVIIGDLSWGLAVLGILFGAVVGYFIGRAGRFRWHDTEDKVVAQMDIIGIVAIVVYILLRFGSDWVAGQFLSGAALSTLTLGILGGALLGRFIGTGHSIRNIIETPRY